MGAIYNIKVFRKLRYFHAAVLCRLWEIGAVDSSSLAELNESELKQILEFANKIAAITCSRSGADSPWRKELD